MIAFQDPPIIFKPVKPLIRFVSHVLYIAANDQFSPEAIELRALSRNSAYCVQLRPERNGNQRYILSLAGLILFRKTIRTARKAALVDIRPIANRAYEQRVLNALVADYGESAKEAARFVETHDLQLSEWREEGIAPEIAARLLFDDIRELYTCPDCGCDNRTGWHQEERGYHSPSYDCGGERRCW